MVFRAMLSFNSGLGSQRFEFDTYDDMEAGLHWEIWRSGTVLNFMGAALSGHA
jgi:hypothetical protein